MTDTVKTQQNECPQGCCQGNEILCISIPCPVTIVLLGLTLTLELQCVRLTSPSSLSATQVQQHLQVLGSLLGNLLSGVTAQAAAQDAEE